MPVYVEMTKTIDVDVEIDVLEELDDMDQKDLRKLRDACNDKLGEASDMECDQQGIDVQRGMRELAKLIDRNWNGISHHAQFVARQIGV